MTAPHAVADASPGEILLEEFMAPLGLSQNALGRALRVPPRRINEIVHGKRSITPDTALRLARYFGTSAQFWLGIQQNYDLATSQRALGELLDDISPHPGIAA